MMIEKGDEAELSFVWETYCFLDSGRVLWFAEITLFQEQILMLC